MNGQTLSDQIRDHFKLVHFIANRYLVFYKLPPSSDYDDLFQVGCVGLWEALQGYDEAKGKFSTFAAKTIAFRMSKFFRQASAKKRGGFRDVSLSAVTIDDCTVESTIPSRVSVANEVETKLLLESLPPRERAILTLRAAGYSQPEIARMFGTSQAHVSRLVRRSVARLRGGESA